MCSYLLTGGGDLLRYPGGAADEEDRVADQRRSAALLPAQCVRSLFVVVFRGNERCYATGKALKFWRHLSPNKSPLILANTG